MLKCLGTCLCMCLYEYSLQSARSCESTQGMGRLCGEVNSVFYLRRPEMLEICWQHALFLFQFKLEC